MDDLINELAVQAGAELYGPARSTNIIVNGQDADALMRKFAELVAEAALKTERERTDKLIAEIQSLAGYWENKYNSIT
jgi:hypothetical protein